MKTRRHTNGAIQSVATYSECELYRYELTRVWDDSGKRLAFIMLNPSTADELRNDPTIERCERRARSLGFGAYRITNIFAFRATRPRDLKKTSDPIGQENDEALRRCVNWADLIVAAWGTHGEHMSRGDEVSMLLRAAKAEVYHLGLTKAGHPRHPLYVPYATEPMRWTM